MPVVGLHIDNVTFSSRFNSWTGKNILAYVNVTLHAFPAGKVLNEPIVSSLNLKVTVRTN